MSRIIEAMFPSRITRRQLIFRGVVVGLGLGLSTERVISEKGKEQSPMYDCLSAVEKRLQSNDFIVFDYTQKGESKATFGKGAYLVVHQGESKVLTMEIDLLKGRTTYEDSNRVVVNYFDLDNKKASQISNGLALNEAAPLNAWPRIRRDLASTGGLQYSLDAAGIPSSQAEIDQQTTLINTAPVFSRGMNQGYAYLNDLRGIQIVPPESSKRGQYVLELGTFLEKLASQLPTPTAKTT